MLWFVLRIISPKEHPIVPLLISDDVEELGRSLPYSSFHKSKITPEDATAATSYSSVFLSLKAIILLLKTCLPSSATPKSLEYNWRQLKWVMISKVKKNKPSQKQSWGGKRVTVKVCIDDSRVERNLRFSWSKQMEVSSMTKSATWTQKSMVISYWRQHWKRKDRQTSCN